MYPENYTFKTFVAMVTGICYDYRRRRSGGEDHLRGVVGCCPVVPEKTK